MTLDVMPIRKRLRELGILVWRRKDGGKHGEGLSSHLALWDSDSCIKCGA